MSAGMLAKPQMRGLLAKRLRVHIIGAFAVSLSVVALYKDAKVFGYEDFTRVVMFPVQTFNHKTTSSCFVLGFSFPGNISQQIAGFKRVQSHHVIHIHTFCVAEPRKQAYANFYKNYDAMKEFELMREAGVFQSAQPKGK